MEALRGVALSGLTQTSGRRPGRCPGLPSRSTLRPISRPAGGAPLATPNARVYNESRRGDPSASLRFRAPCKDAIMPVPMEFSRIIISEINEQQVIYLKEIGGERTFPILIGTLRGDQHRPAA